MEITKPTRAQIEKAFPDQKAMLDVERLFDAVRAILASVEAGPLLRLRSRFAYPQADPIAKTTAATLTAAEVLNGIITGTQATGGTVNYTLPTGTLMDAAAALPINHGFEWSLINLSAAAADTITLAPGTDHTIVGTRVVASAHATTGNIHGNAARWFTRKTAANTFVTYRLR